MFLARSTQSTLDGVVTHQPCPPAFTTDGLVDYIVELVVSKDEVISTVNFNFICVNLWCAVSLIGFPPN